MKYLNRREFVRKTVLGAGALGLGVFGGLSLAACSDEDASTTEGGASGDGSTGELFPIRVITQTVFNEIIVGDTLGFFEDEGIKIEYIGTLPQGVTEFQLLEQGEADAFVSVHPPQIGQARVAGIDAVAVAPGSRDTKLFPHMHYLVPEDSPIQTLDDLKGKTIGIPSIAACTTGLVEYWFANKSETADAEFVALGTNLESALLQSQVDASTSHNPFAGKALAAGGLRRIATSNDVLQQEDFSLAGRGFLRSFIEEHPDVVQGFVNALYRSRLWINDHVDEAAALNATSMQLEPEDVSAALWETSKTLKPQDLERWVQLAEIIGNWEPGQIVAEELYDNSFGENIPDVPESDKTLSFEA
ncbi:MAG: ABC transporter substrate-binding protein [Coriobacteriales bacterium]|jgi:ABC-type nitrate/sulfonate/bicarbonate transport system substrate-binding protein|nr:ABC transporter substrate-binding protein [Coriobacteriales bacterium]